MTFYTIWKYTKGEENATLLEEYGTFRTKHMAFKNAKKATDKLIRNFKDVILVRKITEGSLDCLEWVFEPLD